MENKHNISNTRWYGTTQDERIPKMLLPSFVKVDERSVSDLLAFTSEYSKLINYYNLDNAVDGDWSRFINNDVSIFLATVISTDLTKVEKEHSDLLHDLTNAIHISEKNVMLQDLFKQIIRMAKQINDWYEHALRINRLSPQDANDLEYELENAIHQQLSNELGSLLNFQSDLGFHSRGEYSNEEIEETFNPIWFKPRNILGTRGSLEEELDQQAKISKYTKQVRLLYRKFHSVTSYIIRIAPKYFEQANTDKDDHSPDIGLLITFMKLFRHNQEHINTLTKKHLDFYYYDVLKQKEKGLQADKINVYFKLARHVDYYVLPAGTELDAGRDSEGNNIVYVTDQDIEVNHAEIDSLKSIYISKNSKISKGIGSNYRLVTNIYSAPIANSKDGLGARFLNNNEEWPTFGEEILNRTEDERQMEYAQVGWAVSAPILEMKEGLRIVKFRLEFEQSSIYTMNLLIKDILRNWNESQNSLVYSEGKRQQFLNQQTAQEIESNVEDQEEDKDTVMGDSVGVDRNDVFTRMFKDDSIEAYFSTEDGWYKADTCEVLPPTDWAKSEITIVATLVNSSPPIATCSDEEFSTEFPVVKFMHKNIDTIYSYSFMKELILEQVNIEVTVKGMNDLMLSSSVGALDPSMPFQPFGPLPELGSYLLVGSAELFKKDLTDLRFNIRWHNTPKDKRGFKDYYKVYKQGIENDSFEVQVSALTGGNFFPPEDGDPETQLRYPLFNPNLENREAVSNKTVIKDIDLKAFNIKPDYKIKLPTAFSNNVRSGYFKMELVGPEMAFGHGIYTGIYTKAITHNTMKKKGPDKPVPNEPLIPVIKELSIDYSASTRINLLGTATGEAKIAKLYHIHPFGVMSTFAEGRMEEQSLLPVYDEDGYLFIGFKELNPPCPLSIYFELKENMDLFSYEGVPQKAKVNWSYLVNNKWKSFSETQILDDSTNDFNNSGIISLDLPKDLTKGNDILPAECHWIRVSVEGEPSRLGRAKKVAVQAVSATWKENNNTNVDEHLSKGVEANTVSRFVGIIKEISSIHQPFKSFAGKPGESQLHFYRRISERLRHKNRAIASWDYERLVLERFPFLYQVKCVTYSGNEEVFDHTPGKVSIVVVPKVDGDMKYDLPKVNFTVLEEIKDYLKGTTSPFIDLEVRNPVYERLKISCRVRFEKHKNNGTYLKKLNKDIIEFMCPWLLGINKELNLGGHIPKDMILSFIEKRPYVEFVTRFSVVQVFAEKFGFDIDDTAISFSNSPIVQATKPWAVLIPMEFNPIYLLDDPTFQPSEKASVDTMIIDGDFVVTEEKDFDMDLFNGPKRRSDEEDDY
ncbi:MAG: hypothetical protein MK212_01900 [Saprospiraceae bacterium]|nr:hypothetical protein [Saprospiraceae bacterium]